jgi:hypothetical protein
MEETIKVTVDREKVINFLNVQDLVNVQIKTFGKADPELADYLEKLSDALTIDEIDYLLEFIRDAKKGKGVAS